MEGAPERLLLWLIFLGLKLLSSTGKLITVDVSYRPGGLSEQLPLPIRILHVLSETLSQNRCQVGIRRIK